MLVDQHSKIAIWQSNVVDRRTGIAILTLQSCRFGGPTSSSASPPTSIVSLGIAICNSFIASWKCGMVGWRSDITKWRRGGVGRRSDNGICQRDTTDWHTGRVIW
jgi:hypothetical protein